MTRTSLVVALANAHRALLDTLGTPLAPKGAAQTLAKVEQSLVDAVDGLNAAVAAQKAEQDAANAAELAKNPKAYVRTVRTPDEARVAVLNAGSRKALERLPLYDADKPLFCGGQGVDVTFVLRHSAPYAKAAQKRGLVIDDRTKIDLLRQMAGAPKEDDPFGRPKAIDAPLAITPNAALFTDGKVQAGFAERALVVALTAAPERRAAVAPMVAAIWKAALKQAPGDMEHTLAMLAVIHDPALAGPYVPAALVAHALVGTKRPHKDKVEHKAMEEALAAMSTAAGRKALLAETGDLATWLSKGAPLPTAVAAIERARASYQPARTGKRWF